MKCPLCKKQNSRVLHRFKGAVVQICSSCEFIYSVVKKRPTVDTTYWNTPNKEYYDYYYESRLSGLHQYYIGLLRNQNAKSVLDIGAGLGYFVSAARGVGLEVDGYEPGKVGRDFARKHLDVRLRALLPKQQYDAVTLFHTLEHVPTATTSVRRLKSHLKPNGIVLVEVPNQGSLLNRIRGRNGFDPFAHVNFFTMHTLQKLFVDQGFEIVSLITRQSRRTTFFLSLVPFKQSQRESVEGGGGSGRSLTLYKLVGMIDLLFSPLRFLLSIFGQGDELVLVARKSGKD